MDYSNKSKEELIEEIFYLKKKEESISFIFNNINGIFSHSTYDEKGNIKLKYLSPHVENVLGITLEEYIEFNNVKRLDFIHSDDVIRIKEESKKTLIGKKENSFLYRFFNKKLKKYIWIEENQHISYGKDGNIIDKTIVLRDVTYKKTAELHLKENEEKYRTIFSKNLAGVFITKDDIIIDCNNSFAKIFGYKKRVELIGKNVTDLYVTQKEREIYINDLKKNSFLTNYRIRHKNKNGDEIWVLTNVYLKKNGKIEGTLIDITGQINIEKQLEQSKENYKNLIDNSPYGTIIHVDGVITYANPKALELFEIKDLKDLKDKKNIFDYLPQQYQKQGLERRRKVLNGEEVPFTEIEIKKPFSNKKMVLETKAIRYDYQGKNAIQIFIRDITIEKELSKEKLRASIAEAANKYLQKEIKEREKVEKKLKENQQYINSIINSSLDIICASNKKGKIIEFNEAAEIAFGYKKQNIIDKEVINLYASKENYIKVSKALKEKGTFIGEIENRRKNGDIFTSFLSASVLYNEKGESIGTMGVSRDITELKEAEKQLIKSLNEKEVLLKEVHHRVKNNLQVISSILNLQSSYVKDENTLNILKESQNRIKSMSFIHESLYQTNDFSSINFSEYIVSLSKNLVHSYGINNELIELDFIIDDVQLNLDASIPCGLIVNELVSNALKYAFKEKKKGTVTIKLSIKEGNVNLIIKDNGVGISDKIDFRNTETLGLQLVASLVEQIEGKIELIRNKGTEYIIIFKHE